MKKVLISGASGFMGQHSIPLLLDRGYEVPFCHFKRAPSVHRLCTVASRRSSRLNSNDLLAPEAGLLGHDEHLQRRPWPQGIHEPKAARSLEELSARDSIVRVDMLQRDRSPLRVGVGRGTRDLPRDRLLFIGLDP